MIEALLTLARSETRTQQVAKPGPIIPAEHIERLPEPFHRLDANRAAQHDGLGLGLSIVRAMADVHDATLAIRSQTTGGLDIQIRLPAHHAPRQRERNDTPTGRLGHPRAHEPLGNESSALGPPNDELLSAIMRSSQRAGPS
jgi:Histidine kinase-, DNA gyrase B-, and HSP90-like ATPase